MTPIPLSRRVSALKPSATVAVSNRAKDLRREGKDVLSFAMGEPDFDTPQKIKQAAIDALLAGQTKYMPTLGDLETRQVIADKLTRENAIPGLSAEHVAISAGGKHALFGLMHCLLDPPEPGQAPPEVLLPVPAWVSYAPIAELAGGKIVEIPTDAGGEFKITPEQLRAAITPRSRLFVINSPSNPCGTMYTPDEIRTLARVIAEGVKTTAPGLVVLSDEIYERIVFGGVKHFSIGSVPEIAERVVTINGLSKSYAMTGWRVGYCACPGEFGARLIDAVGTLQGQMTTNITSFVYPAIREALSGRCDADVDRMREAFARRGEIMHAGVSALPGFACPKATGAYYVFPDISAHFGRTSAGGRKINSAMDFAEALLSENLVACVPGEDFGGCGRQCIRLSFGCGDEQIREGLKRIEAFVGGLK